MVVRRESLSAGRDLVLYCYAEEPDPAGKQCLCIIVSQERAPDSPVW